MALEIKQNDVLRGKIKVWQPVQGYRSGIDAVLLAAYARGQGQIIDAGAGVGTISLCLSHRCQDAHITAVEIQKDIFDLLQRNIVDNKKTEQIKALHEDLISPSSSLPEQSFDEIVMNPPYFEAHAHRPSPTENRATARSENTHMLLSDWIGFAVKALKDKGILSMIYKTERLDDALTHLHTKNFGDINITPLWSRQSEPAKRFILQARKNSRQGTILHPGLIIHNEDNSYTREAEFIFHHGARGT